MDENNKDNLTSAEENNTDENSSDNLLTEDKIDVDNCKKKKKKVTVKKFFKVFFGVVLGIIMIAIIIFLIFEIIIMLSPSTIQNTQSYSTAIDLDQDEIDTIDRYVSAVNNAKAGDDFSLKIETASEIQDVKVSISLFQTIINSVLNSMDTGFNSDEEYDFKTDKDTDPNSIIQPADMLIAEESYNGISSVSSTVEGNEDNISFVVAAEEIDFTEIMSMMELEDMDIEEREAIAAENRENMANGDFPVDDIKEMEEYQTFIEMVPNHSQYFDLLSFFTSIMGSFTLDEDSSEEGFGPFGSEEEFDSSEMDMDSSEMLNLKNGTVTFGDMQIAAVLLDGAIQSISFSLPINIDISANVMNKDIEFSYTLALSQNYVFTY